MAGNGKDDMEVVMKRVLKNIFICFAIGLVISTLIALYFNNTMYLSTSIIFCIFLLPIVSDLN